jgi:hypothetical protein
MAATIPTGGLGLDPPARVLVRFRCLPPMCGLLVAAALGCGRAPLRPRSCDSGCATTSTALATLRYQSLRLETALNEEEAGLGSVVADIRSWMSTDVSLPPGYHWEIGGHYVRMQEAFRSLLVVMVVAVLLVFIMLAFQFRGYQAKP